MTYKPGDTGHVAVHNTLDQQISELQSGKANVSNDGHLDDAVMSNIAADLSATDSIIGAGLETALIDSPAVGARIAASASGIVTIDQLPATGLVSAHRCGGGSTLTPIAPEATIAGARLCQSMGAHILDVDYRVTADNVMIVMHDNTVDRTTDGSGNVSDHASSALPKVIGSRFVGSGWLAQPVPTILEFLREFGGKTVITMEAKDGVPSVAPLAAMLKSLGLERSVFINTNAVDVVTEIVTQGCLAHLWAWQDTTLITPGIAAGATLLEVPYNATTAIVSQCTTAVADPNSNLRWFVAGPIWQRAQRDAMTPGIMGHVTDALGMTNRPGNDRLVNTIAPSLAANKRGIGWYVSGAGAPQVSIAGGGITSVTTSGATDQAVYLGDLSGTPATSYTLRYTFKASAALVGTTNTVRVRMACTIPNATGADTDTDGYVIGLRGNGQLVAWTSGPGFAAGVSLGTATGTNLVAGTTYTIDVVVTPTTITIKCGSQTIGPISNTDWRGGHVYAWFQGAPTAGSVITSVGYL